jgi:TolB-like protein
VNLFALRKWALIASIILCMPLAAAASPVQIAVLPFTINADKDYAFLQQAVADMLTSRLSAPGKVVVVDPALTRQATQALSGESGPSLARKAGAELQADYAVHGSITILGENVSIDAVTVDINGDRPPLTFFKQTQNLGGVIPQIDQLAAEINTRLLGAAPAPPAADAGSSPQARAPAAATPDIHVHPEKLLRSGQAETPAPQTGARSLNPSFETAEAGTFWKSRNFSYLINAIDVGDVDGDGLLETVVATPDKIIVYRFAEGRQQTVAEIKAPRGLQNISVSIGDINGRGAPEIFVTALTASRNVLESYVLEFDGTAFKRIIEKSRYYYSVVQHHTLGALLLGQRQSSQSATPFDEPIYEMVWKGDDYIPDRRVLPGGRANILGLAYGDIMNEGGESFAGYDRFDFLRVTSSSGKIEWTSDRAMGGTLLSFALPPTSAGESESHFYLPVRLRSLDINRDGKLEVLAFRNEGGTGRGLGVRRWFSRSTIEALAWDGLGLTPVWQTRQLSGRIQDIVVADFNNDGRDNILAAVVSKEGSLILTDAQSSLIAFEINR